MRGFFNSSENYSAFLALGAAFGFAAALGFAGALAGAALAFGAAFAFAGAAFLANITGPSVVKALIAAVKRLL